MSCRVVLYFYYFRFLFILSYFYSRIYFVAFFVFVIYISCHFYFILFYSYLYFIVFVLFYFISIGPKAQAQFRPKAYFVCPSLRPKQHSQGLLPTKQAHLPGRLAQAYAPQQAFRPCSSSTSSSSAHQLLVDSATQHLTHKDQAQAVKALPAPWHSLTPCTPARPLSRHVKAYDPSNSACLFTPASMHVQQARLWAHKPPPISHLNDRVRPLSVWGFFPYFYAAPGSCFSSHEVYIARSATYSPSISRKRAAAHQTTPMHGPSVSDPTFHAAQLVWLCYVAMRFLQVSLAIPSPSWSQISFKRSSSYSGRCVVSLQLSSHRRPMSANIQAIARQLLLQGAFSTSNVGASSWQ